MTYLATYLSGDLYIILACGLASIIGHNFPIWLKFKGGKGVATSIGVMAIWSWDIALLYCATWLCVAIIGRISSLSALLSFLVVTIYSAIFHPAMMAVAIAIMAVFITIRHKDNIKRLYHGQETKIKLTK